MQEAQFIQKSQQGIDEVRISDKRGIQAPFFVPELKGPECLQSLLIARNALEENNPIMVPGYRWKDIRSKPQFKEVKDEVQSLVLQHPFIYNEPVELFRYSQPKNLVTYAFQGDRGSTREFNNRLKKGKYKEALRLLPPFFQPFVETQMKSLLKQISGATVPMKYQQQSSGKVHEAWRDSRADKKFVSYFEEVVEDAGKSPNATVLPPVPPVLKSSGMDAIHRTRGYNVKMAEICDAKRNEWGGGPVTSYLHFYIDQGIFDSGTDNDRKVLQAISSQLDSHPFAGVALTISNLPNVWEKGNDKRLERFINDISNIARERHVPVILPRSGWYGAHLSDYGVQGFSNLMNGNFTYTRRSGGISELARYGTVPIYGEARDLNAEKLSSYLNNHGGTLPHNPHLPDVPPTFNTSSETLEGKFGKGIHFRIKFGKPRRLTHIQEAKEFRDGLRRGNPNPARRYLERSSHLHLS